MHSGLEKRAKLKVSQSTFEDYQRLLINHVRPILGKKKLSQISVTHLQDLVNEMIKKGYAPSTIRYTHSIICGALRQAVKERLIATNPAREVDLPKKSRKKPTVLNPEETRSFLASCDSHKHGLIFEFALITGMRPEEYLALQWPDILFQEEKATINRTVRWGKWHDHSWYFGEGKTEKAKRTVPLPGYLLQKLRAHYKAQLEQKMKLGSRYEDYKLVFATEVGTPYSMDRLRKRHLGKVLKDAGLGHIRLYDLRHTCATLLLRAGVNLKIVSDMLGHASIKTTADIYMQSDESMQREATDSLVSVIFRK